MDVSILGELIVGRFVIVETEEVSDEFNGCGKVGEGGVGGQAICNKLLFNSVTSQ